MSRRGRCHDHVLSRRSIMQSTTGREYFSLIHNLLLCFRLALSYTSVWSFISSSFPTQHRSVPPNRPCSLLPLFAMSHNVFPSPNYGDRRSNESYDEKATVDMIDRVETANTQGLQRTEAPELVRNMSPEERAHAEKVLVRKIDFRLMPMLVLMYILNYLDRNNIASARLAGLETDLALTSSQYETSVSILFVGYLLMQSMSDSEGLQQYIF